MRDRGCTRLLGKRLSPNDNSKNQIYLGGDYSAIHLLPFGRLVEDASVVASSKRARLKAAVSLSWIDGNGAVEEAAHANLILYPKYPEVRLSGVLLGLRGRDPSMVIANRDDGRWLFLGIVPDGRILAYACSASSPCAAWAEGCSLNSPAFGVFREFALARDDSKQRIQAALRRIASEGWIRSKRLDGAGRISSCEAENCGGYTLEAELGIRPNGRAEPDFEGWEVKQFNVEDLERPVGEQITLFTPEPDGGVYSSEGVEAFLRRFGYPDMSGIADRINFGGAHKYGVTHPRTNLILTLAGWDAAAKKIESVSGGIQLVDSVGTVAAVWSFAALINHWKRKHAKAAYVPSTRRLEPREYRYGFKVLSGIGTDFPLVLDALVRGQVFYDPGIKMEQASGTPIIKRRSQFRIRFRDLSSLYQNTEWWDLAPPAAAVKPRE
jgi:hypothetical protein